MVDPALSVLVKIIGSVGLVLAYCIPFWRIFKSNPGDRFLQCASMTVMATLGTMVVYRTRLFPEWTVGFLMALVYILTTVSIFLMCQQGYRALRKKLARKKSA